MEPEIRVGYSRIVTISCDSILGVREWRDALGVSWPFLSDQRRMVQKDLEIQEFTDPHHDPMIPYTLMLEPRLVVHQIYNGYWYWGRPTPEEVRQGFRDITRLIRPDWDITASGQREKWEHEDRASFFPYRTKS